MMPRTIVFDAGGVIVQWRPVELLQHVLPQQARDASSARRVAAEVFHGFGGDWAEFDRGRIEPEVLAARIAARTGYPLDAVEALIAAIPAHLEPMPESVALLERIRDAGLRLLLLSNMPRPYADHLEAVHPCFGWFEARVFSGRLGLVKPEPAMFEFVREQHAVDLDHALFIDDHADNIAAARACGWQALMFESAAQCGQALRDGGWLPPD